MQYPFPFIPVQPHPVADHFSHLVHTLAAIEIICRLFRGISFNKSYRSGLQLTMPPSIPPPAHSASVVKKELPIWIFPFPAHRDTTAKTRKYTVPINNPHRNLRLPVFFPMTKPPKKVPAT